MRQLFFFFLTVSFLLAVVGVFAEQHDGTTFSLPSRRDSPIGQRFHKNLKTKQDITSDFPAEGVYAIWRNDALMRVAELFTLQIANEVNQYTTMPDYSGSTSSATYTFSDFNFDINLEGPKISSSGAPELTVGWDLFEFIFVFNFHVCATSWPNPCDDGWVEIYTTDTNVELFASLDLDFSGATVSLTSTGANLQFNQGDIEIYVQCTSTFCLVPVDDISNAIAQNFVSVFQSGIQTSINTAAKTMVDTISTTFPFSDLPISLQLDGKFALYPSTNPNLVLIADGVFTPNGQTVSPPFSPATIPPDSVFSSPGSELSIVFTDYMIRTAVWALDLAGEFDFTITNSELPDTSPVHLTTNDPTMQNAVPALKNYPNMDIVIKTTLANVSSVDVTPSGVVTASTINAAFTITNSSLTLPGWTLAVDLDVTATLSVSFNASVNDIQISTALSGWGVDVAVVSSNLGTVNPTFFASILRLALSFDTPTVPNFLIPTPTDWAVGDPTFSESTGYGEIGSTLTYTVNVPSEVCGGGAHVCPLQNTCCQWNGAWGCCTLPSASCCSTGGCCPQGTQCDGQGGCQ